MNIDIGRVFSNTWEMIKQRFWLLLGLWAVFFAVQMVFAIIFSVIMGGSFAAAASGGGDAMLEGLGVGAMVMIFILYIGYIMIALAQQCSMTEMASPIEKPEFGQAFTNGFKAAPTLLGLIFLLLLGYIGFAIVAAIVGAILSILGEIGGWLMLLLIIPAALYLMARLSVIVPVVSVDKERNPFKAIGRTWNMTNGKALPIIVVFLIVIGVALLMIGIPIFVMFGSAFGAAASGDPSAAAGAVAGVIGGFLLIFPLFIIYSIFSAAIISCLHAEVTDSTAEKAQETFS